MTLPSIVQSEPVEPHLEGKDLGADDLELPADFGGATVDVDVVVRVSVTISDSRSASRRPCAMSS